jgi:peptidyl-dipeptidase Dcp
MLATDASDWFDRNGGLTPANGQPFCDTILSKGHTEDYATMFRAFFGKDPDIGPYLENMGIDAGGGRVKGVSAATPKSN